MEKIISQKSPLSLEAIIAPLATTVTGIGFGYALQQNKKMIDGWHHNADVLVGATVNIGYWMLKDFLDVMVKKRDVDSKIDLGNDLKYLGLFNAAGVAGYVLGMIKDSYI